LLAPGTRNSTTLALLITPRVMVSVVGGSFGDGVWVIKLWSSRRADGAVLVAGRNCCSH
jgi:hypothetical protein